MKPPVDEDLRIAQLFSRLDKKKKGFLDSDAFLVMFDISHQNKDSLLLLSKQVVKECDKTLDGKVTFNEFRDYVLKKEAELKDLFDKIAKNNVIKTSQLRQSFDEHGIKYSPEDIKLFMDTVDLKNDGVIDLREVDLY